MDFDLSEEHESFRRVVRDFAQQEIAPHAAAWDERHTFPVEVVLAMGRLGLFGLIFPERWGGGGGDFAGGRATYAVVVTNLGPSASVGPIEVTDKLPASATLVSAGGPGWTCDPIVGVTIGIAVLGEARSAPLWAGFAFAIAGILAIYGVIQLSRRQAEAEERADLPT